METVKTQDDITPLSKNIKWYEITIIVGISAWLITMGAASFKLLLD